MWARPSGLRTFEATFAFTFITARRLVVFPRETLSIGFRVLVSRHPAIQTTGLLTFAPAGLSPAEHASLRWTHTRTCSFPASGSSRKSFARVGVEDDESRCRETREETLGSANLESRCRETREETLGSANLSTKRQRIAELARTTAGTSSPPCASRQASHGRRPLRQRERNSSVKNRMRESCTSGCVSSEGWHVQQEKGLPGQESEAP